MIRFIYNITDSLVELYDFKGDDLEIYEIAAISRESKVDENRTPQFIEMLLKKGHLSVFEHVNVTFKVEAPIFVVRQWFRHRNGVFTEKSLRHTEPSSFYVGNIDTEEKIKDLYASYITMVLGGVPKEKARLILPMCTMTTFFWTVNLRSLFNFLEQRLDKSAQFEIQEYAKIIARKTEEVFPITMRTFKKLKNLEW